MNAYMGMRITEWEDGEVNIGIAVSPTTRKSAPIIGCYWTRDTQLSNPNNDGDYILTKSAFILRPATSHRHKRGDGEVDTGFNIKYAYQPHSGTSDLSIVLTSNSSIQEQDKNQGEGQSKSFIVSSTNSEENITAGMNGLESEVSDELADSARSQLELQEVKKSLEEEDEPIVEGTSEISGEKGSNLETPQVTKEFVTGVNSEDGGDREKETTRDSSEEKVLLQKPAAGTYSSGMKRVSWVEDIEKFSEEHKGARNNSKENKRESVRKSNAGKSSNRSPTRKQQQQQQQQHEFNSHDTNYRAGKRNSGDKSRIPVIAGGGDYHPTSCEFYRRQMLRECCQYEDNYNPPTLAENWYGYTSLQRYAGQKVVQKFAAEQKRLEEDISNRRKTEIWILGSDLDEFVIASPSLPIRKKTIRLQPIQIQS